MTNNQENDTAPEMPEFFKGMACAYEDCAQFIENMRSNLPPELDALGGGLDTIAAGFRQKINSLTTVVAQNMAAAANGEGENQQ